MKECIEKVLKDKNGKDVEEIVSSRFQMLLMENRIRKLNSEKESPKSFEEFCYIEPVATGAQKKINLRISMNVETFISRFMNEFYESIYIANPTDLLYYSCISCDNPDIYDEEGDVKEDYYKKIMDILPLVKETNIANKKTALFDLSINDARPGYSLVTLKKEHKKRMKQLDYTVDDMIDEGLIFERKMCKTIDTVYLLDMIINGKVFVTNIEAVDDIFTSQGFYSMSGLNWDFEKFAHKVKRIIEAS